MGFPLFLDIFPLGWLIQLSLQLGHQGPKPLGAQALPQLGVPAPLYGDGAVKHLPQVLPAERPSPLGGGSSTWSAWKNSPARPLRPR